MRGSMTSRRSRDLDLQGGVQGGKLCNPLLPGAELGTVAPLHMLRDCKVPTELLSRDWPMQVNYAAQVKQLLERYHFKQLTHWGHAVIYEHHRRHDVTQCGLEVLPTKIRENGPDVVHVRMFWDADNDTTIYSPTTSGTIGGGTARGKQGRVGGHVGVLIVLRELGTVHARVAGMRGHRCDAPLAQRNQRPGDGHGNAGRRMAPVDTGGDEFASQKSRRCCKAWRKDR